MSTPPSHACRRPLFCSAVLALAVPLVVGLGAMPARADAQPAPSAVPPAPSAPVTQAPEWVPPPTPMYAPTPVVALPPGYQPPPPVQWQPAPPAPYSVPRRTTGQVLTVLGIAHGLAATIVEGMFGFYSVVISGPLHASGAILTSVGVPLWMSGSKLVQNGRPITVGIDVGHGVTMSPRGGGFELSF